MPNKKIILWVLLLVAIVLVGAFSYYFFTGKLPGYQTPLGWQSKHPSTIPANWIRVDDEQFGLSFSHPPEWGPWLPVRTRSYEGDEAVSEMTFEELERSTMSLSDQIEVSSNVNGIFRRYDNDQWRYEEVCYGIVDLCDTMKQQDLLEEKKEFTKTAEQTIGGAPATIQDFYDVPSGYLVREARFYTPTYRIHLRAIYDIGGFFISQGPNDPSLHDTANNLLGSELSDPINRLSKMYPDELQEMSKFYENVDRFLGSITVHP